MGAVVPISRRRWLSHTGCALAVPAAAALGGLASGLVPRRAVAALGPRDRVLEEARSPYNHIVIGENGDVITMYFVVDGVYYIESRLDRSHPRSLDLDYTRTMMAGFVLNPQPKKILMIGFGGGQISNYLFERIDGLQIDGVDIDPEVIRLARKYFGVPNSPRYRTHAADGRLFVEQAPTDADARWDMILLDAFRGVFVPLHLKTAQYYQTLLSHLSDDGVVVANLHNATPMYRHDRATFDHVFPQGYSFHTERGRQTIFVASANKQRVNAYAMQANAARAQPYFDFDLRGVASRWYLGRDWDPEGMQVLTDDFTPDQLEDGIDRHNQRCNGSDCEYAYPTR